MSQSLYATPPLLSVEQVVVFYEQSILALRGVTLKVGKGQMVALLGANGAGKSTTLKAISSLVRAERGEVTEGRVVYQGQVVTDSDPANLVLSGLFSSSVCSPRIASSYLPWNTMPTASWIASISITLSLGSAPLPPPALPVDR